MRKIYSLELLRKLHLSRYIYFNEEHQEVYAWFGGNEIKIFDFIGEEIGHANIIKKDGTEYTVTDVIIERDVQVSIDNIVNSCFEEVNA
tara:strand:+ start:13549 stop:13815 length:267 start_codon:yes stop_codon:yes gene_type:complete